MCEMAYPNLQLDAFAVDFDCLDLEIDTVPEEEMIEKDEMGCVDFI